MDPKLEPKKIYKIYDKQNNGAALYGFARYEGKETFTILNRPKPERISFTKEQMSTFLILNQTYPWPPKKNKTGKGKK